MSCGHSGHFWISNWNFQITFIFIASVVKRLIWLFNEIFDSTIACRLPFSRIFFPTVKTILNANFVNCLNDLFLVFFFANNGYFLCFILQISAFIYWFLSFVQFLFISWTKSRSDVKWFVLFVKRIIFFWVFFLSSIMISFWIFGYHGIASFRKKSPFEIQFVSCFPQFRFHTFRIQSMGSHSS